MPACLRSLTVIHRSDHTAACVTDVQRQSASICVPVCARLHGSPVHFCDELGAHGGPCWRLAGPAVHGCHDSKHRCTNSPVKLPVNHHSKWMRSKCTYIQTQVPIYRRKCMYTDGITLCRLSGTSCGATICPSPFLDYLNCQPFGFSTINTGLSTCPDGALRLRVNVDIGAFGISMDVCHTCLPVEMHAAMMICTRRDCCRQEAVSVLL